MHRSRVGLRIPLAFLLLATVLGCGKPRATLPMLLEIPATEYHAIDGIWEVSGSHPVQYRIEAGRMFLHDEFDTTVFRRGMVIARDIQEAGPTLYDCWAAIDEGGRTRWSEATLAIDGGGLLVLSVGERSMQLRSVALDDPDRFAAKRRGERTSRPSAARPVDPAPVPIPAPVVAKPEPAPPVAPETKRGIERLFTLPPGKMWTCPARAQLVDVLAGTLEPRGVCQSRGGDFRVLGLDRENGFLRIEFTDGDTGWILKEAAQLR